MSKLMLIVRREYMAIVASKSFIAMTLLSPLILLLCAALPIGMAYINEQNADQETVTVIDQSAARYGLALKSSSQFKYVLLSADAGQRVNPKQFHDKSGGSSSAIVVIPPDVDSTLNVGVYSDNTISSSLKSDISRALSDTLSAARIAAYHIPNLQQMVEDATVDVDVQEVKWSDDGSESASSTEVAMVIGMVFALIIYMFVLSYGAMVMNSVVEEKANRIVEVMVSSCKPFELMMGKIAGVGLAGLTQFAVWTVLLAVIGSVAGATLGIGALASGTTQAAQAAAAPDGLHSIMQAVFSINYLPLLLCFVAYFVGGYLMYASIFSAFGSSVDQASDASQFLTPIMLLLVVALYAGMACIETPNGPMAVWCSMIPFTSPIVMMVRLPYDVPAWQLLTSLALLYATAALMVWVSGRIYRTGILLYGKKHSLAEIARWFIRG